MERLLNTWKIDCLYVNGARFLPPAAWVARRRSVPLIFHCHCRLSQQTAIRVAGESLRISRGHVIACCHHAAEPLKGYVLDDCVSVLYNGVAGYSHASLRELGTVRRIGVLGRIEPEKGQLEFVQAVRLIAPTFPDCRFVVVGAPVFSTSTYYNSVVKASEGLPIEFAGWQHDVSAVFSKLDLLVVPSTPLDATPRVILEAFTAGVPVVALPSGGIPEIVIDGRTGFLARHVTVEGLADRIISVLTMPTEDLIDIARNAKIAWQDNYTLERYQRQVCDFLSHVAAQTPQCLAPIQAMRASTSTSGLWGR
jgi:glycosyltransferase involved in cell wall biosynthesis